MKPIVTVSACAAAVLAMGLVAGQVLFSNAVPAAQSGTPVVSEKPTVPAKPAVTTLAEATKPSASSPAATTAAAPAGGPAPSAVSFWGPSQGQGSAGSLGLPSLPAMAAPLPPSPAAAAATAPIEGDSVPPGMPLPDMASAGVPSTPRGPRAYNAIQTDSPYIAITFDDGPNPETTPKLLKILADRNIKATFFVLGSRAVVAPEILRAMVAAGHEVANHSWNHPQLTKLTVAAADKQIEDTNAVIQDATGVKPVYLRPPYGSMNGSLQQHIIDKYQMSFIYWSVDPLDWKNRDPNAVYDQIMRQVRPGAIILAHDIHPTTVAAMPRVLDALLEKGYKFMTVSELISHDKPGAPKVASAAAPAPKKKVRPASASTASASAPTTTGSTRSSSQRGPVNISPVPVSASGTRPPAAVTSRPPASAGIY